MSKGFRPTYGRVQNAAKLIGGKNNTTIRSLDEEEGELEEKEGIVVSIKQDFINGTGWKVKADSQTYMCSCATSMYELPETKERGGYLYPTETVKVKIQINPILKVNTITEIVSSKSESETLDISKWKHGDEPTTVIAKPRSAISISDGFIQINYDNNNKVVADNDSVKTKGKKTEINTKETNINSETIKVNNINLIDLITGESRLVSNEYSSYDLGKIDKANISVNRTNNITQLDIYGKMNISNNRVIGEIKDQKLFPLTIQSQQLVTDGTCTYLVTVDTDGIIYLSNVNECTDEDEVCVKSLTQWSTPQVNTYHYIKVIVRETCDYCDEGTNTKSEFINYCPQCNTFNTLIDTPTSIKCKTCRTEYCQNCGTNIHNSSQKLKFYKDNYISAYGTACKYCNSHLIGGVTKQYVNYCPECGWGWLTQSEMQQDGKTINILKCNSCNSKFCSTCGIDQDNHGLTLTKSPAQYSKYKEALRKLKYIKDGV